MLNFEKIDMALKEAKKELKSICNPTHIDAKEIIVKYFVKFDIPLTEYQPYMANNILQTITLK